MSVLLSQAAAAAHMAAPTTTLALPQFDSLKNTIITILVSLFMVILIVRMFTAWAQKRWGEMIAEGAAAIFAGWFVFAPDNAQATIVAIVHQIFG
ncbi:hypothetical protein [Nakamurella endophytica]|uniref:Uncharacterized protein n=1 Tax=Nakamurella endophytica TaxID=1748367 RepID=A0A917TCW4_9ACTN|nr:hypothetical protein [Nakamurella endophytica]GGM15973.1 hypothetical protein GCM10011594_39970 [Nakamurella endophytica]